MFETIANPFLIHRGVLYIITPVNFPYISPEASLTQCLKSWFGCVLCGTVNGMDILNDKHLLSSPASHHGGRGLGTGRSVLYLWQAKCHWEIFV